MQSAAFSVFEVTVKTIPIIFLVGYSGKLHNLT